MYGRDITKIINKKNTWCRCFSVLAGSERLWSSLAMNPPLSRSPCYSLVQAKDYHNKGILSIAFYRFLVDSDLTEVAPRLNRRVRR